MPSLPEELNETQLPHPEGSQNNTDTKTQNENDNDKSSPTVIKEEEISEDATENCADENIYETEAENAPNESEEPHESEEPGAGIKALSFVFDLTELFVISFAVVIVVLCFFLRHSPVSGSSMVPTIHNKDTLLVSNIAYTPERGDVIIVQSTHNLAKPLVKRVIAVGGDEIEINFERWMIMVNGEIIEQRFDAEGNPAKIGGDYVNYIEGQSMRRGSVDGSDLYKIGFSYDPSTGNYIATVPQGRLFILGDNRNDSKDSRDATVGFVDERLVVGQAFFRLTPFSNIGTFD